MAGEHPFLSLIGDFLKIAIKYLWAVAGACAVLLFSSPRLLVRVHLNGFVDMYGMWIGLVFIASLAMAISDGAVAIVRSRSRRRAIAASREATLLALRRLDPNEKAILREFILQGSNTIQLPIDQVTVAGLLQKGILQLAGAMGERSMAGMLVPVSQTPISDDFVTPGLIDLPVAEPTDGEWDFLRKSRPAFLPEIAHHNNLFHRSWFRH